MSRMFHSWPKFLVVVLVAGLQCFAPLIHAHTNGVPGDHDIHAHGEETGAAASVQALDVDHHHGQAIGVAKEYKRDYTLPLSGVAVLAPGFTFPQAPSLASDTWRSFAAPGVRFTRPSAQAP
ncbi:MAG: hypothetical protein IV108_09710 [Burkholderiales bacterium]|nr:hypothetical protein [Burkholderiales bacterium]